MNIKLFTFIIGISAFFIAGNAAFFSITGIAYLFSGAFWSVSLMAGSLEVGKLVSASFLYKYWNKINTFLKLYMVIGTLILVGITSMGIFRYLSKAYQSSTVGVERLFLKQTTYEDELKRITADKNFLIEELDIRVKELPNNYITAKRELRTTYNTQIAEISKQIYNTSNDLSDVKLELIDSGVDVGPLLYIAKTFNTDIDTIAKWVIIILIFVFDPLAVALVIAFNIVLEQKTNTNKGIKNTTVEKQRTKTYEENRIEAPKAPEKVNKIKNLKNKPDDSPSDWITPYRE